MKTPPFLLLAALLFWGWQSDFLLIGAVMGVVLEAVRFTRFRWELDDADFSRIWGFCTVLNVALIAYVFTNNEAGGLNGMLHGNAAATAANASVLTATRFFRWLPMTTFAFMVAQAYNLRPSVPLTGISLVLRWRRRKGDEAFTGRYLNISYPYFIICLFAAGIHANTGTQLYFWGLGVLLVWGLWAIRPSRFGWPAWLAAVLVMLGLSFSGMLGIHMAQRALQSFNAQWMAKFFSSRTDPLQTMTSMGRIGKLKLSPRIVIWLEPREVGHVPEYLREASYRNFDAKKATWYAGGVLNDFELLQAEPDNTSWSLVPERNNPESVNITCYLNGWSRELEAREGLLPLPSGCGRLEKVPPSVVIKKNKTGAVLAAGLGLLMFDALYGPGITLDSPPDIASTNHFDLNVATNELPALTNAIAELNLPSGATPEQKRRAVAKFFFDKFTYSTWQGADKVASSNATPLTKFLTTSRSGHCEYFASATVLLLRELGIPARYAVGYYVHETRGTGFIVRERDAHAWCLAWNEAGKRWEDFDTTPPSWVELEKQRSEGGEWFADLRSWIGLQIAKFRWRQANLQQYIFWALIPVMLVLLYYIIFRRRGKFRATENKARHATQIIWPGLDSEFYELEKRLALLGVPRQPGEPLSDWLERALAAPALADLRGPLRELLRLHYRHRFDPQGLTAAEREELKRRAVEALQKISPSA